MSGTLFALGKPLLHAIDAEKAHNLTVKMLRCPLSVEKARHRDLRLSQEIAGLTFPNPIGLAAGFDKNGECADALFGLGFGFVEVGTVTLKPQDGNDKPRVFRDLKTRHVINRMGFPNHGADIFERNVKKFREKGKNKGGLLGINIGKNKDSEEPHSDYVALAQRFAPIADYLTVNISSPNTPGLRELQSGKALQSLLKDVLSVREDTPVFLKLAPDLSEADCADIVKALEKHPVDGLILTNTTFERPEFLPENFKSQKGGLSGPTLHQPSLNILRRFYRMTHGEVPIIGVGGISNAQDAYSKIRAGASAIQLYTGLIFHGPALVHDIHKGLLDLMRTDGFETLEDARGVDNDKI